MGIYGIIDQGLAFLASAAAAKPSPLVMKAPEQLEVSNVQSWLNGSVLGLLALNLIALGFYLISLFAPELTKILKAIQRFLLAMKAPKTVSTPPPAPSLDIKTPAENSKTEPILAATLTTQIAPEPEAPATSVEESVELPPPPAEAQEEVVLPPSPPEPEATAAPAEAPPPAEAVPAESAPAAQEEVQLPPPPPIENVDDVSNALSEALMSGTEPPATEPPPAEPPPQFDLPTEVLENPQPDETPKGPDVTEIMTKEEKNSTLPPSPPLPAEDVSGMKESTAMFEQGLKSIEESLNEALSDTPAQDELSIFDPSSIDKVLQEEEKK